MLNPVTLRLDVGRLREERWLMGLPHGQKLHWACCPAAGHPADCGDPRSWDRWMGGPRPESRSGPFGAPAHCPASSWKVLQGDRVVDWRLVRESQLWNFVVDDRNRRPAPHCGRIPGLRSDVSAAEVRQSFHRTRRIHRAFQAIVPWRAVRHRSRPSGALAPLRFLADERFRTQKRLLCRPKGIVRTGVSDRVSSPGRRECRRRAGRWLQKKRRNRGPVQV